jgi:hypothetical protein
LLPVFRHPRCLNCHGGINPFSKAHRGFDQVEEGKGNEQCQDCHDGLPGWRVPGEPVFFAGKSDEELCLQMKRFEKTGESFVEHLLNDHGDIQFIAAGFKGDRALGEGLADYGIVAAPPPGTQAELTAKAQRWVDDLEGHYADSPECGCVAPGIKLRIHHKMEHNLPKALITHEASQADFEIKLLPMGEDKPGAYQGQYADARKIEQTLMRNCTGGGVVDEQWTFYVTVSPRSDSLKVWRTLFWNGTEMVVDCGKFGKLDDEFRDSMLGNGEPFTMPADSGTTKVFTEQRFGDTESLSITVLEVAKGE